MAPVITPNFEENPKVPPGKYEAKILSCVQKQSQRGSPYLNFKLEIVMGPFAGQWVYLSTGLTGKGAQMLKTLIQAAHTPAYENGPFDTDLLIGRVVQIETEKAVNQDGSEAHFPLIINVFPLEDSFDSYAG